MKRRDKRPIVVWFICIMSSYAVPCPYHHMLYPYIMYHHIMVRPSLCTVIVGLGETSGQTPYRGPVHMYRIILCCTMSLPSYAVPYIMYHHIMVRPSLYTVIVGLGETSGQTPYRGLVLYAYPRYAQGKAQVRQGHCPSSIMLPHVHNCVTHMTLLAIRERSASSARQSGNTQTLLRIISYCTVPC